MDLERLKAALLSIPLMEDADGAAVPAVSDLLCASEDLIRTLRKLGVQQMRDSRDLLAALERPGPEVAQLRDAWQREQQRAVESERQLKALARAFIATFDVLDRMAAAFRTLGMEDWAVQTTEAIHLCLGHAEKAGLVTLGTPGEPFDETVHDLSRQPAGPARGPLRVDAVASRGYALNGQVLRRAAVEVRD
jgi:molecular chaperone GrpE (heat shock protein)